jgi:hypothetical protein
MQQSLDDIIQTAKGWGISPKPFLTINDEYARAEYADMEREELWKEPLTLYRKAQSNTGYALNVVRMRSDEIQDGGEFCYSLILFNSIRN